MDPIENGDIPASHVSFPESITSFTSKAIGVRSSHSMGPQGLFFVVDILAGKTGCFSTLGDTHGSDRNDR